MGSEPGVNVFAHFCCPSGLQQSALSLVKSLGRARIPTLCRDVVVPDVPADRDRSAYLGEEVHACTLLHVQPEPLLHDIDRLSGLTLDDAKYRIAYWYWESTVVPDHWAHIVERKRVREVWAASRFTADALRRSLPVPVHHLPPGLELPAFGRSTRAAFRLPRDRFIFLFAFDMRSVIERKNPLGLAEAFHLAFRPEEPVHLVIRPHHAEQYRREFQRLCGEAGPCGSVTIIERPMSRDESFALIDLCDCYVSLHRAEGLGLTMAEAMLMGKPVIATVYSGNMDFMTAQNSYLVDFELTARESVGPYAVGTVWAEPSVDHAAALMRRVYEHSDEARERADRGRAEAAAKLSPESAGSRMASRLAQIW